MQVLFLFLLFFVLHAHYVQHQVSLNACKKNTAGTISVMSQNDIQQQNFLQKQGNMEGFCHRENEQQLFKFPVHPSSHFSLLSKQPSTIQSKHVLVAVPKLPVSHKEWTVLLHMHPSSVDSGSNVHVVVTDKHGRAHTHVVDTSLAKHGGPIALGVFDLTHEPNSNQHVRVAQVFDNHQRKSTLSRSGQVSMHSIDFEVQSIPDSYDFTKSSTNCWPGIQDQGACGSCYSWTAMVIGTSRQCSAKTSVREMACYNAVTQTDDHPCNGGYTGRVLDEMRLNGFVSQDAYKITNPDTINCYNYKRAKKSPNRIKLHSAGSQDNMWRYYYAHKLSSSEKTAVKAILLKHGPIGIVMPILNSFGWHAKSPCKGTPYVHRLESPKSCCHKERQSECRWFDFFMFWKSSCKDNSGQCDKGDGNHIMTLVGWKYIGGKLAWRVQNSWGDGWNDGGFIDIYADDQDLTMYFEFSGAEYYKSVIATGTLGYRAVKDHKSHKIWNVLDVKQDSIAEEDGPMPGAPTKDTTQFNSLTLANWAEDGGCLVTGPNITETIALKCWHGLVHNLLSTVMFSQGLIDQVRQILVALGRDLSKVATYPLKEVVIKLATLLHESIINFHPDNLTHTAYNSTKNSTEKPPLSFDVCQDFFEPLGFSCVAVGEPQTQVVRGVLWTLPMVIAPHPVTANSTRVEVDVLVYTDAKPSNRKFRFSLRSEGHFEANHPDQYGMEQLATEIGNPSPKANAASSLTPVLYFACLLFGLLAVF